MLEVERLNQFLEGSIREYIDEARPEIEDSIISHPFEKDGEIYFYNLQVAKVEFPLWICVGGNQVPKIGCHRIHRKNEVRYNRDSEPLRCAYCGNTDFRKIEDIEELKEWRDIK